MNERTAVVCHTKNWRSRKNKEVILVFSVVVFSAEPNIAPAPLTKFDPSIVINFDTNHWQWFASLARADHFRSESTNSADWTPVVFQADPVAKTQPDAIW